MNIIDFHTHVFPDDLAARAIEQLTESAEVMKNHTDGTLNGLRDSMSSAGIAKSVLLPVATKPAHVPVINQNAAQNRDQRFVSFGALLPTDPHWEKHIAFLVENKIPGVKLHPEYQRFEVDDKSVFPMYEALAEAGLMVTFHAGKDPSPDWSDRSRPSAIHRVAQTFPKLRIIAAHMGGFFQWDEVEETLLGTEIYLDTSAVAQHMPPELFVRMVNRHPPDRILFGTDSPWFDQKKSLQWVLDRAISDEAKERIVSRNAKALLGYARTI